MLMLRATHVAAMATAAAEHQRTKNTLMQKRADVDRLQTHCDSQYALCGALEQRVRDLEAEVHAAKPPFKWGAEPAPEAKRAHLVDRAMQVGSPFPELNAVFLDRQLMDVNYQRRMPYAGTATAGRMPGAGSVKP